MLAYVAAARRYNAGDGSATECYAAYCALIRVDPTMRWRIKAAEALGAA